MTPPPVRDPRLHFAAERTFLAWIRTGLALMGFGFVVARFGIFLREITRVADGGSSSFSVWVGTSILLVGVVVNVVSAIQHVITIRDLSDGREITGKPSATGIALSALLAIAGLAMAAYLVFFR